MTGSDRAGRPRVRRGLLIGLVLLLVAVLVVAGLVVWRSRTHGGLGEALDAVPAGSLRVGYTDWAAARRTLHTHLGSDPQRSDVERFVERAYDSDFGAVSSIDDAAGALQQNFGFSPGNAQWEAFAQGRAGAAMVLKLPDTDFSGLADHLRDLGFTKPKSDDGVWRGGVDLVAGIDPTISPELQYVALLADQHLVVSSDTYAYAVKAAAAARGDAESLGSSGKADDLEGALHEPVNAMLWADDFACEDLAMSHADADAQAQAKQLVRDAGGVDPLAGLAMGMSADRTLHVVAAFSSSQQAEDNLRSRARLAVGEAVGAGAPSPTTSG